LPLTLLSEWLTGHVGGGADLALQASVARFVVAGNAAADPAAEGSPSAEVDPLKKVGAPQQRSLAAGMAALDAALSGFGGAVPVDLMPGATDPAGHLLPQQPMHPCMLPQCSRLSTVALRTNPFACSVDGVPVLGTSGQPVTDLLKYSAPADEAAAPERALDALEMCLELRHVAPTAPDTLGCYPFKDTDPFLLDASPAVFFAGNQPAFATRLFRTPAGEPVRLVAVPDFRETRSIVLVNLRTLDAHTVSFAPEAA